MLRRVIPLFVIVSLLSGASPAPTSAMSTAAEIQLGQQEDQQIVASSVIETDPLLNAYVQGIAGNLWNQVARKDVPYSIKIIKDSQINSFATMGGFVYVYEGLIDFVQSDDELASVIGHETGHIERRHVITTNSKAEILNILFGIASIFSPIIYEFGGLAEAGLMAKVSRDDELQADRYGLQLMSRAGYDPESMVTMMAHLAVLQNEHSDAVSKYLQDHPDPQNRVAHLMGYPELDPTLVTPAQKLVQASGDEERARYDFARLRLGSSVEQRPAQRRSAARSRRGRTGIGTDRIRASRRWRRRRRTVRRQPAPPLTPALPRLRQMEAQQVTLTKPESAQAASRDRRRADRAGPGRYRDFRARGAGQGSGQGGAEPARDAAV